MDIGALNQQPSWRQPGRRPTSPARGLRGGSQGNRFPDLTREEREVLIKFHWCFECRRLHADHTAANCPEKRQKAKGGDGRGPNFLTSVPSDAQEENRQRTSPVRATGERSDDEWVRRPDECPQWIQEFWKEQEEEVSNGEIAELSRSETPIKMPQTAPKWGMPKRLISGEGYTDEQIEEIQRNFKKTCGEKETGGNEIEKLVQNEGEESESEESLWGKEEETFQNLVAAAERGRRFRRWELMGLTRAQWRDVATVRQVDNLHKKLEGKMVHG